MNRAMKSRLLREFEALIDEYGPIEAGKAVNFVDAFFAYRILLGRMPHVDGELGALLADRRPWREFLGGLLASDEYRHRMTFLPPGMRLMSEANGFSFWFDSEDREMGAQMACGLYEPGTVDLIQHLVRPGMVCLDIGAQKGLLHLRHGPQRRPGRASSFVRTGRPKLLLAGEECPCEPVERADGASPRRLLRCHRGDSRRHGRRNAGRGTDR